MTGNKTILIAMACGFAAAAIVVASPGQVADRTSGKDVEQAVLARLAEIQNAAEQLDPDKVFSFVLENDNGALVQNGKLLRTRQDALEATRKGFQGLQKVNYSFSEQHVALLSPTIALAVGEGMSSATTNDGRTLTRPFAQSVVFVLTNGEWKVFHAHRSFPPTN